MTVNGNERLDACSSWAPAREECEITVADIAPNEEAAGPKPRFRVVIFVCVEIGQFAAGPVMKPLRLWYRHRQKDVATQLGQDRE
jgi:hypothetical protein